MNTAAKVRLSPAEMHLVMDPEWILTKNSIIGKVVGLLAALSEDYRPVWENAHLPGGAHPSTHKITRGENYKGLPWVVLDYPRIFGKEDILAIRTLFWWGRHFSITLHLKGRYKELFLPVIQKNWKDLSSAGFHIGISDNEWQHEHTPENYQPMDGGVPSTGHDFLKLSAACGLDKWEEAPEFLLRRFETLVRVLNSPAGETGL
jgi:hypothetical protein